MWTERCDGCCSGGERIGFGIWRCIGLGVMGLSRILSAPEIAFYRGVVFTSFYHKAFQPLISCFENIFHWTDNDNSDRLMSVIHGPEGYSSERGPNRYPRIDRVNSKQFVPNLVVPGVTPTNQQEMDKLLERVHNRYYELGMTYGWLNGCEDTCDGFFINAMMGNAADAPVNPNKYTFNITAKKNNVFALSVVPLVEDRSDAIQILDSYDNAISELRKCYDLVDLAKTALFKEYTNLVVS